MLLFVICLCVGTVLSISAFSDHLVVKNIAGYSLGDCWYTFTEIGLMECSGTLGPPKHVKY